MYKRRQLPRLLLGAGALSLTPALAQTVLIADDFQVDTSANYTVVDDGTPDGTQTFAFDYVAAGIPLAPRSAAGGGRGLQLTANDTLGVVDAWTLFHNTLVTEPHYRLRVDVWINFVGNGPTTEHAHVGVAGNGTTFNSLFTPISGSGAFIAFTGDGGSASDYRWFRDPANTPMGETQNTTLPNDHPSYLGHASNNTGAFYQSLFPSPPATIAGSPGNIWTTLEIEVDNNNGIISFLFDGQLTFQGSFANLFMGQVSLGIADVFPSISGTSNVFMLYDNLEVTTVGPGGGIGSNYCTPVPNSTGGPGLLSATGSALASANNVTLQASNLPNNAFGFFLTSRTQGNIGQPGTSVGVLCLSGSIGRYVGPGQIQNTGTTGAFALGIDLTQTPQPNGFVSVMAGDTWNFQAWHRDVSGGVPVSNFTEGLSIVFQ